MSNDTDWKAPITLIAHGRSGTSLIQNVFDAHPEVSVAGETADVVFGTWYSLNKAKGIVPARMRDGRIVDHEERVADAVRATLQGFYAFNTPFWMQKPIGQPFFIDYLRHTGTLAEDDWFSLYWRILRSTFPRGRFVTVLRQPCDVVLSAVEYWRRTEQEVWRDLATMARCLTHSDSLVTYAVSFDELVASPEVTIRMLFDHVGVSFDPSVLRAFEHVYVPDMAGWKQSPSAHEDRVQRRFSRRAGWTALDRGSLDDTQRVQIAQLWAGFGCTPEFP